MINGQVVQIAEVLQRSVQGRTNPFLCRGNDGRLYYVKGRGAGRRGLISEWLASCIALAFGLPIAEFRIVEISEEMAALALPDFADLGTGFAFGSAVRENVVDLTYHYVDRVPPSTRKDIAVFDWWVHNDDRTLTPLGGNVNLLWDIVQREIVVMDYNLAFDDAFSDQQFLSGHVFAGDWNDVYQDFLARPVYEERMRKALSSWDGACDRMPDEWFEVGPGVPTGFLPEDARRVLDRYESPDFWKRP
jgi:hypothetical protein